MNKQKLKDINEADEPYKRPKIVVMCGSSRYVDIMAVCEWLIQRDELAITMGLNLLPSWYCQGKIPDHLAENEGCAKEMDELHLRKIDIADEIFVVNFRDYIGESTSREIKYAQDKGKKIRWYNCDEIGATVQSLIARLAAEGDKKEERRRMRR